MKKHNISIRKIIIGALYTIFILCIMPLEAHGYSRETLSDLAEEYDLSGLETESDKVLLREFDFDETKTRTSFDTPRWALDKIQIYYFRGDSDEEVGASKTTGLTLYAEPFNENGGSWIIHQTVEYAGESSYWSEFALVAPGTEIGASELVFETTVREFESSYSTEGYEYVENALFSSPMVQLRTFEEPDGTAVQIREMSRERKKEILNGKRINDGGSAQRFIHDYSEVGLEPEKGRKMMFRVGGGAVRFELYYVGIGQGTAQTDYTAAEENTGEDEGTAIASDIVRDTSKDDVSTTDEEGGVPAGAAAAAGAAAVAAAGVGAAMASGSDGKSKKGGNNGGESENSETSEHKRLSRYKMYVNKDFGNSLKKGEEPRAVYARIVEITSEGFERERDDLSRRIEVSSGDNVLKVEDGGFTENGYKVAWVSVPDGNEMSEGSVTFSFKGEGGVYTRHVVFNLIEAAINFADENKGLPAHYEKELCIPFGVVGLGKDYKVSAVIEPLAEVRAAYEVRIEPHEEVEDVYNAYIKDVLMTDAEEAGTTHIHMLKVNARTDKESIEAELPLYRIHMGLTLLLEGNALGCYLRVKEYRNEMAGVRAVGSEMSDSMSVTGLMGLNPMATMLAAGYEGALNASFAMSGRAGNIRSEDLEPCITEGHLLLLTWNDEKQEIERVSVIPDSKKPCKVVATKVDNTVMAHSENVGERHQEMVRSLGIHAFGTNRTDEKGARIIKLCCTSASLDPPIRVRADITVYASYKEKEYEIKKNILLHSMPIRRFEEMNAGEERKILKWDEHVQDMLIGIKGKILDSYMYQLFSLHDLIDRMLNGYDKRFGYDVNQINNVMEVWTGFIKGERLAANAESYKLSLADDLKAAYAFLEGMRDNGGMLGRIALGVCTAGYSEHIFFAMETGEKMKEAVFACKGDEEFGFWDGIALGAREYAVSEVKGLIIGGGLKLGNKAVSAGINKVFKTNIDVAQSITKGYRNLMDQADDALKQNSSLYKGTSQALENIGVCTNSSSRAAGNAAKRNMELEADAKQRAETTVAERRAGKGRARMTPDELKAEEIADIARERGMEKIREFDKAKKKVAAARKEGGDFWGAKKEMEKRALEIWSDKNSMKALKRLEGGAGADIRMTFNTYRNSIQKRALDKALDDLAVELGKTRSNLYVSSATSNSSYDELSGKTTAEDLDVTMTEINYTDRSRTDAYISGKTVMTDLDGDLSSSKESIYLVIDKEVAEKAIARNLYREVFGVDADTIEDALKFKEQLDITYVQPMRMKGQEIVLDPEAYMDLGGMIDKSQHSRELKGLGMNRHTLAHKGNEWYRRGDALEIQAKALDAQALELTGADKQRLLDEALDLRVEAFGYFVEGTRQITKQVDRIALPRNAYRMSKGMEDAFKGSSREIHELALKVGTDLSPGEFFHILRSDYGIDKYAYTRMMAESLV